MGMTCSKCERQSCMPLPYEQLCARHYIASVNAAERAAKKRFEKHIANLLRTRG